MLSKEILTMPKIDLHCHLDGSLTQRCISRLLGRNVGIQELQVADDCRNLAEYLEKFALPLQCLQTAEGLKEASKSFLLNLKDDNISYVEVRFAPLLSVNEHLNTSQVMEAVLSGLEEGKKECGISYNVIVCAMRHHNPEESLQMIRDCRVYLNQGLCAADLAGNEAAFPMKDFRNLFAEVKRMEIPFTIHAGECGSVENIVESVEAGAMRIGHGIALRGKKDAIAFCKERGIALEMCPISNMQTKAVARKEEYPIREFLDAGLKVTINTDNRTVSNTTIAKEMKFIQENYGITDDELRQVTENAIEASFANDDVKQMLWKQNHGE